MIESLNSGEFKVKNDNRNGVEEKMKKKKMHLLIK